MLDRLSANKLPSNDGGIRLTHMLTPLGGIECEMTITKLSSERFYLNSSIMGELHDLDWLNQHVAEDEDVSIRDVTDEIAILAISGPLARDLLQPLTSADLSNDFFPWLTGQEIEIADVPCIALRVSYVGELGWELHHPIDQMLNLYEALIDSGSAFDLTHYGSYAMNSMRIEKAYKAWGSELTTEITPIEARLERFVDLSRNFVGSDVVREKKSEKLEMVLVYCEVETNDTDCRGNEPIYVGNDLVGLTTSGTWSHTTDKSIAFAYVSPELESSGSVFEIEIMNQRCRATVIKDAVVDPVNKKIRK